MIFLDCISLSFNKEGMNPIENLIVSSSRIATTVGSYIDKFGQGTF